MTQHKEQAPREKVNLWPRFLIRRWPPRQPLQIKPGTNVAVCVQTEGVRLGLECTEHISAEILPFSVHVCLYTKCVCVCNNIYIHIYR